jgi:mediator of RNA polymerase II transcription subunit 17, fungi type
VQQHIPLGSLGAEKVEAVKPSAAETKDQDTILRGWKLQGLNSAANSLLRSADRLKEEADDESTYWEQILAVRDAGWSVCRLPGERHTLGVRFGFAEASADFKDRGLAALRRGDGGKITLDKGMASSDDKMIRVRMQKHGIITGSSSITTWDDEDGSIQTLILRARNSIYEEELFYELSREARLLASKGVRTLDDTLIISLNDNEQIMIDLLSLNENHDILADSIQSPDSQYAEGIVLSLRILLSYGYRQTLKRRAAPPPPLTERKRPTPVHFILRLIMQHLTHQAELQNLSNLMQRISSIGSSAKIAASYTISACQNFIERASVSSGTTSEDVESVVESFTGNLESVATLTLPGSWMVNVRMRTTPWGTSYIVTSSRPAPTDSINPADYASGSPPPRTATQTTNFDSSFEMTLFLYLTLERATHFEILSWTPDLSDLFPIDQASGEVGWTPIGQASDLQKSSKTMAKTKRLRVLASAEGLRIKWGWGGISDGEVVWDGLDGLPSMREQGNQGLREWVREAGDLGKWLTSGKGVS